MRTVLRTMVAALLLASLPLAAGEAEDGDAAAQAAVDELEDFRGLRFGDDVAERRDLMEIRREGQVVVYEKRGDYLTYGQAKLVGVLYTTYEGRLYQVGLMFQGNENETHALRALSNRFGSPEVRRLRRPPIRSYVWEGERMRVSLMMSQEGGLVTFSHQDLHQAAERHLESWRQRPPSTEVGQRASSGPAERPEGVSPR